MNTKVNDFVNKWLTLEEIQNQEYLSVWFFQEFEKVFGFNFNETEEIQKTIPNVNYIRPLTYDKKYIALLIKNAKRDTWRNMATYKRNYELEKDIKFFEESFNEIIRYFWDNNFSKDDFSQKHIEIKKYLANKFPKEKENQVRTVIEDSREKISKIQLYFSKK